MINLIPDVIKENNRFAIKNNRLLNYTIVSALTMVAIGLITGITLFTMSRKEQDLNNQIAAQNTQLTTYKPVEQQGKALYDQVKTINELLNREVRFSEVLPQMAKLLPPGTVLKQLDFAATDLTGSGSTPKPAATGTTSSSSGTATPAPAVQQHPFVINALVVDRETAATLLENIRQSNLFSNADLISVTEAQTNTSGGSDTGFAAKYKYTVTINAYFKKLSSPQIQVNPPQGSKQ